MTKSTGFIDFSDTHSDPDAWRSDLDDGRQGKLFIPQGKRCHETHPDLHIGGGTLIGGNCREHRRHADVNLYVALDASMEHPLFEIGKPIPHAIYYPIQNMKIPTRPDKFAALIDIIMAGLDKGLRIHVGCIGGHGRTGTVIAAVVARLGIAPDNDAIAWVREHYCKKAVENKMQENFLVVNFGCKMPPAGATPYQKAYPKVDKRHKGR